MLIFDKVLSDAEVLTLYKAGRRSDVVSKCAAGKYGAKDAAGAQCKACPAGRYARAKATACGACPIGKSQAKTGQSSCTPCAAGSGTAATGSTACTPCAAGTFAKAAVCTKCGLGKYNAKTGQSSCTTCAAGSETAKTGSTLASACKPCAVGTYAKAGVCTKCETGKYNAKTGQSSCTSCASGYTTKTAGAKVASDCVRWTVAMPSSGKCPAGAYKSGAACAKCAAGKTTLVWQRSIAGYHCKTMARSYTKVADVAACKILCSATACAGIGWWAERKYCYKCSDASKGRADSRFRIHPVSAIGATAATQCTLCAKNYYAKGTACIAKCKANTYLKGTACTACPTGSSHAKVGSTSIADCRSSRRPTST